MKLKTLYPVLWILPIFTLMWGIFILFYFDTFYSRNIDPEYPYLINGLNAAILKFNQIGHYDHPGTPFQILCGLVIRITHLFTGKGSITQDVINRPDYYLYSISLFLIILQSVLVYVIGYIGQKRGINKTPLVILQSGVLLNSILLLIFCRVYPERWLVITSILFIIIYLSYGYNKRKPLTFAIASGIIMGMGLATKFNYLPLLVIPLLLMDNYKHKFIYIGTSALSFFCFILPIINRFKDYWNFIIRMATHDGIYGKGQERMFNPDIISENIVQVIKATPEVLFFLITLFTLVVIVIIKKKKTREINYALFFSGSIIIFLFQLLMVIKHYKADYLMPLLSIYPLFLFIIYRYFEDLYSDNKHRLTPILLLLLICIFFSINYTVKEIPILKKESKQREELQCYVSKNVAEDAVWFVNPSWKRTPYVENALVYGFCYCRHTHRYLPELLQKNPTIITFEGENKSVKIWRILPASLDSVLATGKAIHIYDAPKRDTYKLIDVISDVSKKHNYSLQIDTLFTQKEMKAHILSIHLNNM